MAAANAHRTPTPPPGGGKGDPAAGPPSSLDGDTCIQGLSVRVLAWGVAYFFCSSTMLLANKLAIHLVPCPVLVTSCQYFVSALVPRVLHTLGIVECDHLEWSKVSSFWQVPTLFALAIFANTKVLQTANVETFIVFRNTTPLLVAVCDFFFMGKALPNARGLLAFFAVIGGSIVYTATDQGFLLESYLWVALYLVVITTEMVAVKHVFNTLQMSTWSRVYYTNTLCLMYQPLFLVATREYNQWLLFYTGQESISVKGVGMIALSCGVGLGISFSGTGYRNTVTATTFTLSGVVNKMLTVSVNYVMWDKHANGFGLGALAASIIGAAVYRPAGPREPGSVSDRLWHVLCAPCTAPADPDPAPAEREPSDDDEERKE
eukprot:TRINITY_DN17371_c0_g1_i1.p1 TRINITY_DN17371_c0_g1~~TRINITY_DN17371_c0_g1_i1.p1  ORF type:complete len:399 (+),score=143.00 TRINITY_DN17371_c0_g1_i1:71-1198(+)